MVARKKSTPTLILDSLSPEETESLEILHDTPGLAFPAEAPELDASLCPTCKEPLAWHEEACLASAAPVHEARPVRLTPAAGSAADPGLTPQPYAYAIGQPVQPTPDAAVHTIVWRGQVKARHPRLGLIHRVNVYRLDNGYWDCYYEAELRAA